MQLRHLPTFAIVLLTAGCSTHGGADHRGLGTAWLMFLVGLVGVIIPDIATKWLEHDNRFITRLGAGALLLAGSTILSDHYFGFDVLGLIRDDSEAAR